MPQRESSRKNAFPQAIRKRAQVPKKGGLIAREKMPRYGINRLCKRQSWANR